MNGLANKNIREQLQSALSCFQQSQFIESEAISRNILAKTPDQFDALHLLGVIKYQTQDYENAKIFLNRARQINPINIQLLNTLACVYKALGDITESENLYIETLKINPLYPDAISNYLLLLEQNGKYPKIIDLLEPQISQFPENTQFLRSLAYSYSVAGNFDLAVKTINQAINVRPIPANLNLLNTKGAIFSAHQKYEEACELFRQIIEIDASHLYANINIAYALQKLGNLKHAENHFKISLKLLNNSQSKPVNNNPPSIETLSSKIQFMLATIKLTQGNYKEGWKNYAKRPSILLQKHLTPLENINLQGDLSNKRILIIHDQGLGDELFFLRFIPQLKKRGAHIFYVSSPQLVKLISTNPDIEDVIDNKNVTTNENKTSYDYKFSVADLPLLLKCYSNQDIPKALKLTADSQRTKMIRKELQNKANNSFIGITWRAGAEKQHGQGQDTLEILDKKISLNVLTKELANIFTGHPVTFVILQRNPKQEELEYLRTHLDFNIIDYSHYNEDLMQMMPLLEILDDYIGVSNTNIHLRGCLDKKATVLLPYPPEWRWQLKENHSPWYETFTLIRQAEDGSWRKSFDHYKQSLNSQTS